MRFIVFGAGAIGGVVGGRLHEAGHEVLLVGRGAHARAIRADGLRIESPAGSVVLEVLIVETAAEIDFMRDDVVLLSVKSQDSEAALVDLATAAPADTPIVCMQNGVANERAASRLFAAVYGLTVMLPAAFTEAGVVEARSAPVTGITDLGRYPHGIDETAGRIAAALDASSLVAEARPDIMAWKYRKLLKNLGNAPQALIGAETSRETVVGMAVEEGERVLAAAGIDVVSAADDGQRRGDLLQVGPIPGRSRTGGSTWQSLQRGLGSVETDYLNGEIVLLGRLHGEPTPVNALLQRLMRTAVAQGAMPGSLTEAEILAQLPSA